MRGSHKKGNRVEAYGKDDLPRIVLVGNPNVGKSVIFNRLTGLKVVVSNYPGTTIEYFEGSMHVEGIKVKIVDIPGIYSLIPSDKAEEVAVNLLFRYKTNLIVNIVDATNLERNLYLTLQLKEMEIPMLIDLNMIDMAKREGIEINVPLMKKILGVPVVPTCAISGEGIKELYQSIEKKIKNEI